MKVKATVTFAGQVTMTAGEIRDIPETVAEPLIGCGYLEVMESRPTVHTEAPAEEKPIEGEKPTETSADKKATKTKKEKPAAESEG